MLNVCDRDRLNLLIKRSLIKIAEMPILHHGNPIDFWKGLVYISPPGMQATSYERDIFLEKDREKNLRQHDPDRKFEFSLGVAVGIAIYPPGWDKSQVVDFFLSTREKTPLLYFGDRTDPDGNDYPIFSHPHIRGISDTGPSDAIRQLTALFRCKRGDGLKLPSFFGKRRK